MNLNDYSPLELLGIFITGVCMAFVLSVLLALPILWLWNSTMPELFGLHEIGWWMAWKISMLSSILFKSGVVSKRG